MHENIQILNQLIIRYIIRVDNITELCGNKVKSIHGLRYMFGALSLDTSRREGRCTTTTTTTNTQTQTYTMRLTLRFKTDGNGNAERAKRRLPVFAVLGRVCLGLNADWPVGWTAFRTRERTTTAWALRGRTDDARWKLRGRPAPGKERKKTTTTTTNRHEPGADESGGQVRGGDCRRTIARRLSERVRTAVSGG